MGNIVNEWYETKKNVDEMVHWEKPKLKKWELAVTEFFPAEAKILDVGCGLGREPLCPVRYGYRCKVDISQEVIDQVVPFSVQKNYDIPFSVYDGHKLPFEADSFDVVMYGRSMVLLYGNEYKHEFLLECKRILTNGGLLSYSAPRLPVLMENCSKTLWYNLPTTVPGFIRNFWW